MKTDITGLPMLSVRDPVGSGGGSLDPLGLTPIGEQLAVELIPGFRERQTHPRYLTAIAVSHAVCDGFPADTVASDGVSEPWQVFEWYVVEGLVRSAETDSEVRVPGSQKTRAALAQNLPLCASRYLKTPSIFGFHGVYRLLARTLHVEQADHLADFGFELLDVWQKEQNLPGFHGSVDGVGKKIRQQFTEAVKIGLEKGATDRSAAWAGWKNLHAYLEPTKAGPKEAALIWAKLKSENTGFSAEVLDFLVSQEGQSLVRDSDAGERAIYGALKKIGSTDLRQRITTIQHYENFCRLLHGAFEICRYEITQARGGMQAKELSRLTAVKRAAEHLPDAFQKAEESLTDPIRQSRFLNVFQSFGQKLRPEDFVVALYEHHKRIQKMKPPDGKVSWLERHFNGSLIIRPDYQLLKLPEMNEEFVNPYRINALSKFAKDLQQI